MLHSGCPFCIMTSDDASAQGVHASIASYELVSDDMGKADSLQGQTDSHEHHLTLTPAYLPCQEFLYSGRCLADDAKNYHAWAHRAAIADAFDAWKRELPIITKMLAEDMRNNSAWNHRFLTLQRLLDRQAFRVAPPCGDPFLVSRKAV